jgi:hypothetical protein
VFALPPDRQTARHDTKPASQVRPILGMVGIGILGATLVGWASVLLQLGGVNGRAVRDFLLVYLILTGVVVVIAAVFLWIGFYK